MTRREFLAALAAASPPTPSALRRAGPPEPFGRRRASVAAADEAPPRTSMGVTIYSFISSPRPKTAYEFLEYCHGLGAGGAQAPLASLDSEYTRKVRERAESLGLYLEVIVRLPEKDAEEFERTVKAAKEAGAVALRTACLGGRRYEVFSTLDDWKAFAAQSRARIARAVPILEKYRMPLGLENHKDWTTSELVSLLKEYPSEYLGVCLDTGNNIALLDDPMEVVERLAPYAMATHLKDMAVEEYSEGFLLSEVPLGEGMLDMKRVVQTVLQARPRTKLTLEMITRNPLRVPCLTEKYWATFPDRREAGLARRPSLLRPVPSGTGLRPVPDGTGVRTGKPRRPLPQPENLPHDERVRVEEENVKQCLAYARDQLGLRWTERRPSGR